mmetsp:Transcript_67791/g.126605  ORF Transcript_67791/g.126605 Transcript_67791/m.126605 type:complete len:176 (-) Transcript_67791:143-670(-)
MSEAGDEEEAAELAKRRAEMAQAFKEAQARTEGAFATFTYENGDVYEGQWHENKKHGQGTYNFVKDGTKLIGEWEKGKLTLGKWVMPNGTYYCGKFRYNKPHGKGVWVFKNGSQVTGKYQQREQPVEEEELEEGEEKPDPQVWCFFKPEKDAVVRGGHMFGPKSGSLALVQPPLD